MTHSKNATMRPWTAVHTGPSSPACHLRMCSTRMDEFKTKMMGRREERCAPCLFQISHAQAKLPIIKTVALGIQPTWLGLFQAMYICHPPMANRASTSSISLYSNSDLDLFLSITFPLSSECAPAETSRAHHHTSRAASPGGNRWPWCGRVRQFRACTGARPHGSCGR